jgi:PAS domain-containing protein
VQWVGTCTDIDDQKRAHAELESRVATRTAELAKSNEDLRLENGERERMAESLRESNEKFQLLVDNITDVFWIRSPDMRELLYISPAFERIWGRPAACLIANPQQWPHFILAEDRERVPGCLRQAHGRRTHVGN